MKIQELAIPHADICDELKLYFNGDNFSVTDNTIVIDTNGNVDTDTYFNSFSIRKWMKYTELKNLTLTIDVEGECSIYLCYAWIDKTNIIRRAGDNKPAFIKESSARESLTLTYPDNSEGTIAYYRIASENGPVRIYAAGYSSDLSIINDVKVALGICTYKREDFVYKNIASLKSSILDNASSTLCGKVKVIISDNGCSLDKAQISDKDITCVDNLNLGGSGGFTRCMIEAKKLMVSDNITHIILMDDDIVFDPQTIERTYTLLSLLKPQYYSNAMIGGAMLILNDMPKQFENAALYHGGMLKFENKNIDLRTIRNVLTNERPKDVNYNAWCYCCMPLSVITDDNLPMPFFIHMDDVEYGVRNKFEVITMNGINVWHPFFQNQRPASIVYYDVRNKLITMAELGGMHIERYASFYLEMFHNYIFNYDYNRTILACQAILDFCEGIDAFKAADALELQSRLSGYNQPWLDDDDGSVLAGIDNSESVNYVSKKGLLINYLLPAKKESITVDCSINNAYPYRAEQLIVCNRRQNKYCVYKKSLLKLIHAKHMCNKAKKAIRTTILDSSWEWHDRIGEITNIDYWKNYLKIN